MKLSLYIIVGSLAFAPVVFADDEESQESSAAPASDSAASDADSAETPSDSTASTEASLDNSAADSAGAAGAKNNDGKLKLEDEKPSDSPQGERLFSPAARENMIKINDTVREINVEQRSIYEKKMAVDAELEAFTSSFSERRGRLMAIGDSVNDYITTQTPSDDASKVNDEARQKRADFLKQAVASLSDFRSSLNDLAIKDKVLDQQDEALDVVLNKSLEDLNTAVKTASEAQKHRNEVSSAATDDAIAQAEAAIASALKSVQLTLTRFKDELSKDIDGKIVAVKDSIKSMNEALEKAQKKGDELKALLKNIEVQDALIRQVQKPVVDVNKAPAAPEKSTTSATSTVAEKDKKEVAAVAQKSESESWMSWIGAKVQSGKDYVLSFIHSPAKKEVPTAVVQSGGAAVPAQKDLPAQVNQLPVAAQTSQIPQSAPAVSVPGQDAQVQANQSVATPPGATAQSVTSPSVAGQPAALVDVSALSPKNPEREKDMKQVQTVGKALGQSISRAWAAIGSFFSDIKHGLFEPSDTSNDDARPAAAKTVTIQSKQGSATPATPAPTATTAPPATPVTPVTPAAPVAPVASVVPAASVSPSVVAPEKAVESAPASPVAAS